MTGVGTTAVYRVAAVLLWALAVWHCWISRGLFVDGAPTLVFMMHNRGYALFYDARQTLTAVTQTPLRPSTREVARPSSAHTVISTCSTRRT